jgi:hypothetical protein
VTDTDAAAAWASGNRVGASQMLEFAEMYVKLTDSDYEADRSGVPGLGSRQ